MSVGIMFFADHDLPMTSADDFIKEFAQRSHSNIVLTDVSESVPDYTKVQLSDDKKNTWYFSYWRTDGDFDKVFAQTYRKILMSYSNGKIQMSFELFEKTVEVKEINIKGIDGLKNDYQWNSMRDFLLTDTAYGRSWLNSLLEAGRKYLIPLLHSKQILLTKDSYSLVHENLYGEWLADRGMSIREALSMTPCTVIRNKDCFKFSKDIDIGNVFADPFFLFDL